jgi:hypothetical protein
MQSGDRVYYSIYSEEFDYTGPTANGMVRRIKTITPMHEDDDSKYVVTLEDLGYVLMMEFNHNKTSLVGQGFHKDDNYDEEREPNMFKVILTKDYVLMQRERVLYLKRMIVKARQDKDTMNPKRWEYFYEAKLAETIAEYEEYKFELRYSEYRERYPEDFI